MIRIAFKTTGCKVNQADGEAVRRALADLPVAFVGADQPADVLVVNACAVTRGAERDGRVYLHRGTRQGASVVLAGCLASRIARDGGDDLLPDGVHVIPGTGDRAALVAALRADVLRRSATGTATADSASLAAPEPEPNPAPATRARPLVKVQDGCDCRCTYCIVPLLRGPSRSVPVDDVVSAVLAAAATGCAEIVLAGVDLAAWGRDRDGAALPDLLARLRSLGTGTRFRLSSVEPHGLTDGLLDALAAGPDVAPHLHVPLQSGSDRILRAMGRPYAARDLGERLQAFARDLPDLAVGLDVIVGFPGETDADFDDTRAFVASLPVAYLHVFPFSPRPGTAAADLPDAPAHEVTAARARVLRDLSDARRADHAMALVGRTVEVVDIGARPGAVVESLAGDYTRVFRHDPAGPRAGRFPLCIALAQDAHAWSGPSSQPSESP